MRFPVLSFALCLGLSAQPALAQVFETHGDWMLACSNLNACTVLGATRPQRDRAVFLRISREAGPDAPVVLSVGGLLDDNDPDERPVGLAFEGQTPGLPGPLAVSQDDDASGHATLPAQDHGHVLAGLRKADRVLLTIPTAPDAPATFVVDLEGAMKALSGMDRIQRRDGTVTALASPGGRPASAVPEAPAVPEIIAARTPADAPPAALPEVLRDHLCEDARQAGLGVPGVNLKALVDFAERLTPDLNLWGLRCSEGAYNFGNTLLVGRDDGPVEQIELEVPTPLEERLNGAELVNGFFSPADMTLTGYTKSRGMGDCGSLARWVWDGKRFRLVHLKAMPSCRGILSEDWPSLWQAQVR
ncbi:MULTISPECIES: DUF1176 domain-containing protein [Chelatococcus]|uniref:DUF1176 domain-containing protein n=1 Tax=Chelatococcus caeni TaxID=1348468 RepID=A0A840C412_9HYPH|nr:MULTISPECIES: DUF1176 domain-containing protein [Chelatococcus]ALA16834.1 hypothetical protein AL346_04685 [Chelatococcus sp. CO-6]MBB4019850.1 hypothetical protein [Chelatococcus caeni]